MGDTGREGGDDRLHTVTDTEFCKDAAEVGFDGGFADIELFGDFGVGSAGGKMFEHVAFPLGEVVDARNVVGLERGSGMLDDAAV